MSAKYPLFVKRDLDGFFGLFIDNLVQLLLIVTLCSALCGMTGDQAELIFSRILPGAAVSLLIGNLFYAWQAHRLARRENRSDVCALPYGINTPSLLVYVFFVIAPVYRTTNDAVLAWQMGLIACLGSGLIEFFGSFVAEKIRRHTPRAALLSTLAGIAIGFISMTFALQIYQNPLIAMLPLGVILITYFSNIRFPWGLPGGLLAILAGTIIAWLLPDEWLARQMSTAAVGEAWSQRGLHLPVFCGGAIVEAFRQHGQQILGYMSVIVPMGLFNVAGSLQNIESAEAGGDRFPTGPSLAVNGLGTIAAAFFGSCFPTTIYIGHPGWKGLGARAGYSSLNGLIITLLAFTGTIALVSKIIPIEAGVAIVLWIGIVITAQAFQATPREHAPAVAVGLFPAIAAWGATICAGAFIQAQMQPLPDFPPEQVAPLAPIGPANTMEDMLRMDHPQAGLRTEANGFLIHGMNLLSSGYIFTCMILAAVSAYLIDRKFLSAGVWALAGALLTAIGLMHAYRISGNEVGFQFIFTDPPAAGEGLAFDGLRIAVGYVLMALLFFAFEVYRRRRGDAIIGPGH
ncbi:MAG TPA: NCS2 family permease [Phycisphaerae bacterium]|nr:NCS2 family permease [Phycisphaerae bacterium]